MSIEIENACNGCDTCLGCGRNRDYKVFYCDKCGTQIDETVWFLDGQDLCEDCVLEEVPHRETEDYFDE